MLPDSTLGHLVEALACHAKGHGFNPRPWSEICSGGGGYEVDMGGVR